MLKLCLIVIMFGLLFTGALAAITAIAWFADNKWGGGKE